MKTIVICRHAKSDWSTGLPDIKRPLNKRGRNDAPKMGALLAKSGFMPDLIISSPAQRARETAEAVARELGYTSEIRTDDNIYEGGSNEIIELLSTLDDPVSTVMIFGHNPTLETLASRIMESTSQVRFPTGAMICFELHHDNWKMLAGIRLELKWFLIPKLIR